MESDKAVEERIEDLAAVADAARESFEPPDAPPDEDRARRIASERLGPVVAAFVEVRTGGRSVYLPPDHYDRLERAMNEWLRQYAACYGVAIEPDRQLRTAAHLLVDTHNAVDVARILTGVPDREVRSG